MDRAGQIEAAGPRRNEALVQEDFSLNGFDHFEECQRLRRLGELDPSAGSTLRPDEAVL